MIDASNAESELEPCVEALKQAEYIAVDCEGVRMSRHGPVTVLQCRLGDRLYLIDVQSLGEMCFGDRGAGGVRDVLESKDVPIKLMFDCRMDSDALFHQFDVRLENVMDGAGARRGDATIAREDDRSRLRHRQVHRNISHERRDRGSGGFKGSSEEIIRRGGIHALGRETDDGHVRRYAALDVWLLIKLYEKMMFDLRDDTDDWVARAFKESARRVLAFRELEVAMEQGVFTEESTVQRPTFNV